MALKQKKTKLEDIWHNIKVSINDMKKHSQRNSIFSIKKNQGANPTQIVQQLANHKLSINVEEKWIDRCHHVGKTLPGGSNRSILVKLTSYQHKQRLIQSKQKSTGIVIKEDLTQANNRLDFRWINCSFSQNNWPTRIQSNSELYIWSLETLQFHVLSHRCHYDILQRLMYFFFISVWYFHFLLHSSCDHLSLCLYYGSNLILGHVTSSNKIFFVC